MRTMRYALTAAACLGIVLAGSGCNDDDDPSAFLLRVMHLSYDAPNVDVAVNDGTPIQNLAYGASSGYAEFDEGTYHIRVRPAGAAGPDVIAADLEFDGNTAYTIFATDQLSAIAPVVAEDDREAVAGKAKVRFLHASPDTPGVEVKVGTGDGPSLFGAVSFQEITGYIEVDPGTYSLVVTAAGDTTALITFAPQALADGGVYTVVAIGTFDPDDAYPLIVRVFVDTGDGTASLDLVPAV